MRLFRKFAILAHRYLGVALSLLLVVWFVSGIVMIYAGGMPQITAQARLDRLPPLDLSQVHISPVEASERANASGGRLQLLTVMERPAYRIDGVTVFADTGEVLDEVGVAQSRAIAARFAGLAENSLAHVDTLSRIDQWTLGQSRDLPLHKFAADDADATEVYVASTSGEVVQLTTRRSRMLAWAGTIPHWLYFAALRENQPLWYRTVVWTSTAACVLTLLGLILGVVQFRRTRPLARAIPYAGWMRWHYITGAVFGVFTLTWAFSGLLSMEPYAWTNAEGLEVSRSVFTGGPVELAAFTAPDAATWDRVLDGRGIKEVEFARIQGEHYYVVRQAPRDAAVAQRRERLHQPYNVSGRVAPDRVLVNARTLEVRHEPFSTASLVARLQAAAPDVPIVGSDLLTEYDSYYYSRGRQTPLPVVRVKFADPAETWFYVDPQNSQMLAAIHRLNRVERWLYNGFHSLDFAFWYDRRPLWDIGMLALLFGGLASSGIGLFLGVKRVWRAAVRAARGGRAVTSPVNEGGLGAGLGLDPRAKRSL
jgi:hypothetical protein